MFNDYKKQLQQNTLLEILPLTFFCCLRVRVCCRCWCCQFAKLNKEHKKSLKCANPSHNIHNETISIVILILEVSQLSIHQILVFIFLSGGFISINFLLFNSFAHRGFTRNFLFCHIKNILGFSYSAHEILFTIYCNHV